MIPAGLAKEAWIVNNPALGSYLLWTLTLESFNKTKEPVHPCKLFCLFPFVYYSDTREVLLSSGIASNLHAYISKFSSAKNCSTDIALAIHSRVNEQKEKTLEALIAALDSGLLMIDTESGLVTPNLRLKPIIRSELDGSTQQLYDCARKLGKWLSDMNPEDIKRTIKVVF
ncbi:DUF6521 family protein [Pseudoalteromonas piscicida]|uniref:three component ABC system middle component n=1 Tax=Pseudoalteromonas piscicida TaxID=43662 RepID=UPI001EFC4BFC|nr:three component ABC system middle component [Pseudoalteromonas piscicida]MCG9767665.1 DUF6521 family protein [Pseudoalteromonas piscicida]